MTEGVPDGGWTIQQDDGLWPPQLIEEAKVKGPIRGVGDPTVLASPSMAIIGARRATPYGLAVASLAGRVAAECGVTVVSGGAMGCDAAATRAAQRAGGRTIIVSGVGADQVYPHTSQDIFEEARASGAVIALERWGAPPRRYAFPKRNRLIAGLCHSLLVAEAAMPSGTFSTAQAALDLDRTIYAAPGSIFSPEARGTNWLLEQGASMVVDDQALEMAIALDFGASRLVAERHRGEGGRIISALGSMAMRPEDLASYLGVEVLTLMKSLGELEAQGLVARLPDGRYSPSERSLIGL